MIGSRFISQYILCFYLRRQFLDISQIRSTDPSPKPYNIFGLSPREICYQIYEPIVYRQYAAIAYVEPSYPHPRDRHLNEGILTACKAISNEDQFQGNTCARRL